MNSYIPITTRKRSCRKGNVFTRLCHSVHEGIMMSLPVWSHVSGYHADTPITIMAEAIHKADSRIH